LKAVVEKMAERSRVRVIHPEQNRYFGNYAAIEFLVKSSVLLDRLLPGMKLEVGDLSREKGGRLPPHKSHQNGLDIDIGFFRKGVKQNYYGKSVVNGNRVDSSFDQALQWKFFKSMMTYYHDKIYFILLHPAVKRAMCAEAARAGDLVKGQDVDPIVMHTLRRLVGESSHYNHFHVRMKCPSKDERCVQTKHDLPMSMGCN
jgi:penicillin-insensitive murein endopeptidase